MSLYYDAVEILAGDRASGSLRSRVFSNPQLKSKPSAVYALIVECAKYDTFLNEVVDNAELLQSEPKLSPLLSILLVHDHFFAKGGIATRSNHALRISIERHKARLQAEFTKARLKRKCGNTEALKTAVADEKLKGSLQKFHPRWVRVNSIKTTVDEEKKRTFVGLNTSSLTNVGSGIKNHALYEDEHVTNLLAVSHQEDLTATEAYREGRLILQDKASCFPAELLLNSDPQSRGPGDIIDACAAPGNKTTHLSAILGSQRRLATKIYACERDSARSRTLQEMVTKAGAKNVHVLAKQDFLSLDPHEKRFNNVTHLLLDPSCSGSGIIGRQDIPVLILPNDPRQVRPIGTNSTTPKKRKRGQEAPSVISAAPDDEESPVVSLDKPRLEKLSNLQSRIIEHALSFPAARCISYSTCSVHIEENEMVVARVLRSDAAKKRKWRLLQREEQVSGLRMWQHRGIRDHTDVELDDNQLDACIRCYPDGDEGTMGFFVCCFVREPVDGNESSGATNDEPQDHLQEEEEPWYGFSDNDV